jgi:hypothetical protein
VSEQLYAAKCPSCKKIVCIHLANGTQEQHEAFFEECVTLGRPYALVPSAQAIDDFLDSGCTCATAKEIEFTEGEGLEPAPPLTQ